MVRKVLFPSMNNISGVREKYLKKDKNLSSFYNSSNNKGSVFLYDLLAQKITFDRIQFSFTLNTLNRSQHDNKWKWNEVWVKRAI